MLSEPGSILVGMGSTPAGFKSHLVRTDGKAREREKEEAREKQDPLSLSVAEYSLFYRALLQNIVSFIGLFCKRDHVHNTICTYAYVFIERSRMRG